MDNVKENDDSSANGYKTTSPRGNIDLWRETEFPDLIPPLGSCRRRRRPCNDNMDNEIGRAHV